MQGDFKPVSLSPKLKDKVTTIKGANYTLLSSSDYMVSIRYDGTGRVFMLSAEEPTLALATFRAFYVLNGDLMLEGNYTCLNTTCSSIS